jgi:hypothetical protein
MERLPNAEPRWLPETKAERDAIHDQLERMLASALFSNSKRCPSLFRYVVESTLEGRASALKERTIGVEVFNRDPDYDTNADPVVRATASEIRKRIAQYYHEPGHEHEERIDLLPGSYIPDFHMPAPEPAPLPLPAPVVRFPAPGRTAFNRALLAGLGIVLAALAWFIPWRPRSALDNFWGPVLDSPGAVLLCVGQRPFLGVSPEAPGRLNPDVARFANAPPDSPISLFKLYFMGSQNVALPDVTTLARLSGVLQAKGKAVSIVGESATLFADLRRGPVILVGAFNNDWTLRLMSPLRFSFEREGDIFRIHDRKNPSARDCAVDYATPYLELAEDYALISRVVDPTTDRMVVVVGGLTGYGTIAAGEFLANAKYLEVFAKDAPKHWERGNVQVVIATKVINGDSGPPRVIDRQFR